MKPKNLEQKSALNPADAKKSLNTDTEVKIWKAKAEKAEKAFNALHDQIIQSEAEHNKFKEEYMQLIKQLTAPIALAPKKELMPEIIMDRIKSTTSKYAQEYCQKQGKSGDVESVLKFIYEQYHIIPALHAIDIWKRAVEITEYFNSDVSKHMKVVEDLEVALAGNPNK